MTPALSPAWTLYDIHGADCAYNARASSSACDWLPRGAAALDAMTGGQLTVLGEMPVLCARSVSTPDGFALLREAGLPVAPHVWRYENEADYLRQLARFVVGHKKIVVQHWHPPTELAESHWLVRPRTVSYLNNKANLSDLVPAEHVPPRCRLVRAALEHARLDVPCVIKAATDKSTGGGSDVLVCRSAQNVRAAHEYFAGIDTVIVEKFLAIAENLCLNYAVHADGRVTYLGTAFQVSDADGRYQGNWLEGRIGEGEPAACLGRAIAEKGAALGYRGCVGIDVGILDNGDLAVFDLNFRVNGSTASLMVYPAVVRRYRQPVARFRSWTSRKKYAELVRLAARAMEREWFVPLTTFDPEQGDYSGVPARVAGLLLGASREEVTEREREFAALVS